MPSAELGDILIDGEALLDVLGQIDAAILMREADRVTSIVRPGDVNTMMIVLANRCRTKRFKPSPARHK